MRQLEVLAEAQCVGAGHVAESFEVVHAQGVALVPGAADELGEDVERDFEAGNGVDDADGNDEDETERDAVEDDAGGGVGWPAKDRAEGDADGGDEDEEVPPAV